MARDRRPPDGRDARRLTPFGHAGRAGAVAALITLSVLFGGALVLAAIGWGTDNIGSGDTGSTAEVGSGQVTPATSTDQTPGPPKQASPTAKRVALARCPTSHSQSPGSDEPQRLPSLTLGCLGPGPDVRMDAGHPVPMVVNLWASWCDPCRREIPRLQESADRLGARAIFLGVDTKDLAADAWAFLGQAGVDYAQVMDLDGQLLSALRLPGIPVTVVVDPSGGIVYRHLGELRERDVRDLEAAVLSNTGR